MKRHLNRLRNPGLPKCTLCNHIADPRMGILTKENLYYPLCDGCAPSTSTTEIAARCKKSWKGPTQPLSRFGFNECS